jgi:hypothetical protein
MNAVRQIVQVDSESSVFKIPRKFLNRTVEVIVFPLERDKGKFETSSDIVGIWENRFDKDMNSTEIKKSWRLKQWTR